jgi:transposase-like protein
MCPQPLFCPIKSCPSRGVIGAGNLKVHDSLRQRYECEVCGKTFSAKKGTIFYGLKYDSQTVTRVLTLLALGCPLQAIVAAFHLDERTVADWQRRAGAHCEMVHQHLVASQPRDLGQVQADEVRAKRQGRLALWMAMAISVPTRLWLGGVASARRDRLLIWRLVQMIRSQALERPLLLVTDGLSSYVTCWKRAFSTPIRRLSGRGGRKKRAWSGIVIGRVIKSYRKLRCLGVEDRRLAQGSWEEFAALSLPGQTLNTAYIERLNATFRQRLCGLVRRGRCLLRKEEALRTRMYLVGCIYNFCTAHQSLAQKQAQGVFERTPAMAAGITDEVWSVSDLLGYRIAPAPYIPPKPKSNRGRPLGSKNKPKPPKEPVQ